VFLPHRGWRRCERETIASGLLASPSPNLSRPLATLVGRGINARILYCGLPITGTLVQRVVHPLHRFLCKVADVLYVHLALR
jgi:hypothetical protein